MSTDGYGKSVLEELGPLHRELRHAISEVYKGFGEFHHAAFAAGAMDAKTKELIAFAIAVAERCDGCIAYHARNSVRAGASRQEVAEMLAVAVQMGGGPAMVHAADALKAFDEFAGPAPVSAKA